MKTFGVQRVGFGLMVLVLMLSGPVVFAGEVEDSLGPDEGQFIPNPNYQPGRSPNDPPDRSLNPNLTEGINEPHPYPDYLKRFIGDGNYPYYYDQLVRQSPRNQVQSKVFAPKLFKTIRRIVVVNFENKTQGYGKDATAGIVVARELSKKLMEVRSYAVVPSSESMGDHWIRIVSSPKGVQPEAGSIDQEKSTPEKDALSQPLPDKKIEAVMIGAVTRFTNKYRDRRGNIREGISSAVEFGAYLVSVDSGKVIWGARFVGTQKPSINNIFTGRGRWLDRKELARSAMKQVLKSFYENQPAINKVDLEK